MTDEVIAVKFSNVSAKFRGFCLSDISFSLPMGYIAGIAGKNGAGKTSLLRLITDRRTAYQGSIRVVDRQGKLLEVKENRDAILDYVGIITDQHNFVQDLTVEANVDLLSLFYSEFDRDLFNEKMQQYNVGRSKKISLLSKGECIRFQLAFAIAHHCLLYLFDEATAGLDIVFRKDFFKEIRKLMIDGKKTVMLTTHLQEELERDVDYVAYLDNGKLTSFLPKLS